MSYFHSTKSVAIPVPPHLPDCIPINRPGILFSRDQLTLLRYLDRKIGNGHSRQDLQQRDLYLPLLLNANFFPCNKPTLTVEQLC